MKTIYISFFGLLTAAILMCSASTASSENQKVRMPVSHSSFTENTVLCENYKIVGKPQSMKSLSLTKSSVLDLANDATYEGIFIDEFVLLFNPLAGPDIQGHAVPTILDTAFCSTAIGTKAPAPFIFKTFLINNLPESTISRTYHFKDQCGNPSYLYFDAFKSEELAYLVYSFGDYELIRSSLKEGLYLLEDRTDYGSRYFVYDRAHCRELTWEEEKVAMKELFTKADYKAQDMTLYTEWMNSSNHYVFSLSERDKRISYIRTLVVTKENGNLDLNSDIIERGYLELSDEDNQSYMLTPESCPESLPENAIQDSISWCKAREVDLIVKPFIYRDFELEWIEESKSLSKFSIWMKAWADDNISP